MKTTTCSILRYSRVAAIALLGALAFPATADAKPKDKDKSKGSKARSSPAQVQTVRTRAATSDSRSYGARSYDGRSDSDRSYSTRSYSGSYDRTRSSYYSRPRSGFTLSFGTGYLGSGYYYGPPGASYYYDRPGVMFYRNRYDVPRSYWGRDSYYSGGTDAAVQRALYRLGYYRGPIDGDIGPGTRRAIARFEAANGLPVRGYVSRTLLEALDLR